MNKLQPSSLTSNGVNDSLCLFLDNGVANANESSSSPSSSSSSSSSGGGGTSPDSVCSRGSPLDVDMPERMMGSKMASREDDSGIQSPDCVPDGNGNDNDTSVSIYLDANGDSWRDDRDDHNNLTLALTRQQENDRDHGYVHVSGNHGGQISDGSSVTEPPSASSEDEEDDDDDDDDDDEDSFLSLSSVDVVMKGQGESDEGQVQSSTRRPSLGHLSELHQEAHQDSPEVLNNKDQMQSSTRRPSVGPVSELHQEAHRDSIEVLNNEDQVQSSTRRPSVGLVIELQDSPEVLNNEDQVQSSTRRPSVGPVSELHQEAQWDSIEVLTKEEHMQNSATRPSVGPVSELHQEAHLDSPEVLNNKDQMKSSTRRPSVGPVSELHQEAHRDSKEVLTKEEHMQSSARRPSVDPVNKLHQEAYQDSPEVPNKDDDMQNSTKSLSVGPVSELHEETMEENVSAPPTVVKPSETLLSPLYEGTFVADSFMPIQDPPTSASTLRETSCISKRGAAAQPLVEAPHGTAVKLSITTSSRVVLKRYPRPELKNIRAKVICRAASAPRPANPTQPRTCPGQSAGGGEKQSPTARGRAANRREQGGHDVKKSRSSSNRMRAAAAGGSDPKPDAALSEAEKRSCPSICITHLSSEVVASGDQGHMQGVEVEDVGAERGRHEEEETLQEQSSGEFLNNEVQTVSSELMHPAGVGVAPHPTPGSLVGRQSAPSRDTRAGACVSAGTRTAPPSGVPKMKVVDGSGSGPASSWKSPPNSASSKLPIRSGGLPTSLSSSSLGSTASENNSVAATNTGASAVMKGDSSRPSSSSQGKFASSKPTPASRIRANPTPAKFGSAGQKCPVLASHNSAKTTQNALQRSGIARPNWPSAAAVEKSVRGGRSSGGRLVRVQVGPGGAEALGAPTEEDEERELRLQIEGRDRCITQLRELIAHGNRRLEALALVIQHIFRERDEAVKQRKELSLQVKNLQEELANSASCCQHLERERQQASEAMEEAVWELQEQHGVELAQLKQVLQDFYQAEWDRTHQAYQEEADKYRALMLQQVEEVRSKQEALRREQEVAHTQQMERLRQEYEISLAELEKVHKRDLHKLDDTFKQSEILMNQKIEDFSAENTALNLRLREEEEKRKALTDKSQKDSRVLYLEQELESLKVVLEIKTNQLHSQDKKLMQMDRMIESNVKLEECLKKLQQENEDYKARMDKHAALSKQLSSEQAMLQQTLQKESNVNKRLSMENEELLWKLHNGDLSSPRRLSPSSPFQSPRNSASFPSTPASPR